MTREELKAAAVAMLDRAYIPYSHFPVGAALECSDGTVFTGCFCSLFSPVNRLELRTGNGRRHVYGPHS